MANVHAHAHANAMASFGSPVGFGGLFGKLGARYSTFRNGSAERARIRRELESYTDRQLNDLGLSRLDIPAVAAGQFAR